MNNNPAKPQSNEREVPKEVRFFTNGHVHRRFTWKERFLILLGYSALLEIHIATEHRPGLTKPVVKLNLTANADPKEALREFANKVQLERKKREAAAAAEKQENA
jgi:hypothetical protein